jgi:hypothetical protein
MGALYWPCEQKPQSWGEVWWVGDKYSWVFFDDRNTSETYTEQIAHCFFTQASRSSKRRLKRIARTRPSNPRLVFLPLR